MDKKYNYVAIIMEYEELNTPGSAFIGKKRVLFF